jgi:hypothetical protein
MRRKLFLHVGHGKTGSSFIQSFFALNVDRLAEQGVIYPESHDVQIARNLHITSGNFRIKAIMEEFPQFRKLADDASASLLFSSEYLFPELFSEENAAEFIKDSGFDIEVLLFIRNPIDLIRSTYIQMVKRSGYSRAIDEYRRKNLSDYHLTREVGDFCRNCRRHGFNLRVVSYDFHRDDVVTPVLDFLGVGDRSQFRMIDNVVNRSLDDAEIYLMRKLNEACGDTSFSFLADAFCNALPNVPASNLALSSECISELIEIMEPELIAANEAIGDFGEHYQAISAPEAADAGVSDRISFSTAQIDVMTKTVGEHFVALSQRVDDLQRQMQNGRLSAEQVEALAKTISEHMFAQRMQAETPPRLADGGWKQMRRKLKKRARELLFRR